MKFIAKCNVVLGDVSREAQPTPPPRTTLLCSRRAAIK